MKKTQAFTLIELLMVMLVMIILSGIGVTSYFGVTRGAAMRTAVSHFRSTLLLARQQAMMNGKTAYVIFEQTDTNSSYVICSRVGVTTSGTGYILWDAFNDLSDLPEGTKFHKFDGDTYGGFATIVKDGDGKNPETDKNLWGAAGYDYALESATRIIMPRGILFDQDGLTPVIFRPDGTVHSEREFGICEEIDLGNLAVVRLNSFGLVEVEMPK